MLTLQGHFTELMSKRNEVQPVKSVLLCQFKKPCLQAAPERHTHVWTNRDASWNFKGVENKDPGLTNRYTKLGQLITSENFPGNQLTKFSWKITNIIATKCHILRLKCTKFDS